MTTGWLRKHQIAILILQRKVIRQVSSCRSVASQAKKVRVRTNLYDVRSPSNGMVLCTNST